MVEAWSREAPMEMERLMCSVGSQQTSDDLDVEVRGGE